jgi:hypothetical protein
MGLQIRIPQFRFEDAGSRFLCVTLKKFFLLQQKDVQFVVAASVTHYNGRVWLSNWRCSEFHFDLRVLVMCFIIQIAITCLH